MKRNDQNILVRAAWVLVLILVAGFFYFTYAYLPHQVAAGIVQKSKIHQPLTRTPKEDHFTYKDVSFKTVDGIVLSGWLLSSAAGQKTAGTIVMSHGVFKNREQVLSRAEFLAAKGYQVLLFDHRGCGLSGEAFPTGGSLEAGDYKAAIAYLRSKGQVKKPLILFGFSMGAMAALRAAVDEPKVEGVIADGPLPNVKAYVSRRTIGGSFAAMPGFLEACLKQYDRLTGLSLTAKDLDLTDVVKQFHEKPVLYFNGEKDDLARSEEVRKLFNDTQSHHRWMVYMQDAGHEETYSKSPMIYEKAILRFLTELKKGFPQPSQEEIFKKVGAQRRVEKGKSEQP